MSSSKHTTPAKKVPKRPGWYFDSPLKRVTKDLFGAKSSKFNSAKSGALEPENMEENVKFDLCQEEVEEGDKYRLHLVDKHNVTMEEVEAMADAAM